MKLSVKKGGAFLVVLLLGVALARHATSSSSREESLNGRQSVGIDQNSNMIEQSVATLVTQGPEAVSVPPSRLPPNSVASNSTSKIAAQTLASLPFAISSQEQPLGSLVMDRPLETLEADGFLNLLEETMVELQPLPEETRQPFAPKPEEAAIVPDDTGEAEMIEPEEPAPITEPEARTTILNMLGGEAAYYTGESDMAQAYAAAKKALRQQGIRLSGVKALAIIDFTLPSFDRRMAIYNPRTGEESRHLVAHGHHSGELYLEWSSNIPRSLQSSPGLYRIGRHYNGEHGRSVRMHGLQTNVNDQAFKRSIVLHSAWYVSYKTILENQVELGVPRIGRSHGCPAVSAEDLPEVLRRLQSGSYMFIYPVPTHVPSPQPEILSADGLLQ